MITTNIILKSFTTLCDEDYKELSGLDTVLFQKYGLSFSNEIWSVKNFKYFLPQKELLSYVCIVENKLIGYIVASNKNNSIYIHRFGVIKKGIAELFFSNVLKKYSNKYLVLMVNIMNHRAISFYKKFDFIIEKNIKEIKKYINPELSVNEYGEIKIKEDYKCYLMKKN